LRTWHTKKHIMRKYLALNVLIQNCRFKSSERSLSWSAKKQIMRKYLALNVL